MEAERRIYASPNEAIIGSDNGMSPVQRQAIIWIIAVLLSLSESVLDYCQLDP